MTGHSLPQQVSIFSFKYIAGYSARIDWRSWAAFCLPFLLYVRTLAPTIYNLDSAEFTIAAATGGLIRSTGYPLYLLVGRIWVYLIPFGDFGYRLNLLSAACGALTILFAERILRRWQIGPVATFGALGLLTVSPYFWGLSLIAEVYTMHTALMGALILLLLRWAEQPSLGRLAIVAFLGGLSLGHHAATVLLIPGFVLFAAQIAGRSLWTIGTMLRLLGAGVAGFSIYLYLPLLYLTQPVFNYAGAYNAQGIFEPLNLLHPADFLSLITARSFLGNADPGGGSLPLLQNIREYGHLLIQAFFAVGIAPAVLGAGVLWQRNRPVGLLMFVVFLANALFYMNYGVIDNDTMHLPAYLIWALWLAVGYQWLLDWLRTAGGRRVYHGLAAVIVGCALAAGIWNWPLVDRSHDDSARVRSEALARQLLPNAMVFGAWQTVPLIEYVQLVEGRRPDITAINRFLIKHDDMYALIAATAEERPVYLDSVPPDLPPMFQLRPAGLLFRVQIHDADSSTETSPCPVPVDRSIVVDCITKEP